jgi:hypothetical protein
MVVVVAVAVVAVTVVVDGCCAIGNDHGCSDGSCAVGDGYASCQDLQAEHMNMRVID